MSGSGSSVHPVLGAQRVHQLGLVAPRSRVAQHHLEHRHAVGSGPERPEGGALGQLDVGAGRAQPVAAPDRPLHHEHHVRAPVAVAAHDHARVVAPVQRQVRRIAAEGEPLLPHRRRWCRRRCAGASPPATARSGSSRCRKTGSGGSVTGAPGRRRPPRRAPPAVASGPTSGSRSSWRSGGHCGSRSSIRSATCPPETGSRSPHTNRIGTGERLEGVDPSRAVLQAVGHVVQEAVGDLRAAVVLHRPPDAVRLRLAHRSPLAPGALQAGGEGGFVHGLGERPRPAPGRGAAAARRSGGAGRTRARRCTTPPR